ncbi:Hypothetical predicted protein [Pelobates cultripes]|uniref:Uncharacterized protein n=1 Tax=Pelobates cultripes TaxID=61616 RepID=A0AAD1T218_PELCU|nr:Hypothetical predicted protein [Pelobates cultripes]
MTHDATSSGVNHTNRQRIFIVITILFGTVIICIILKYVFKKKPYLNRGYHQDDKNTSIYHSRKYSTWPRDGKDSFPVKRYRAKEDVICGPNEEKGEEMGHHSNSAFIGDNMQASDFNNSLREERRRRRRKTYT